MRIARVLVVLLTALACAVCSGCHSKVTPRLRVAVTLFPLYDLTRRVVGPDGDVVLLIEPGRPDSDITPSDALANAARDVTLGIRVGLGLDDWLNDVLDSAAPKARRLALGDRVPTIPYRANPAAELLRKQGLPEVDPFAHGKIDPYVWLDPARAALMVKAIAEELARADVVHASAYRSRGDTLVRKLDALDKEVERRVEGWASRSFVSFRPSFGYFADRYHLEVAATIEAYPGRVPPLRYDQLTLKTIRAKGIAGVFREPQFAMKPASIVAEAAKIPLGVLDVLGGTEPVDSYEKLIRFDVDALEAVMKAAPLPPRDAGVEDAVEL